MAPPDQITTLSETSFNLDLPHSLESGIFGFVNFGTFPSRVKVNGKTENLGNVVHVERFKNRITAVSVKLFFKRYLKYLTKKYLKKKNLHDWLHVLNLTRKLMNFIHFQISQDEDGSESEDQQGLPF
uniref:Uncharacterized protein n=1 Tax=Marmota marmota marmota TaxID=9994 RepID=A0A8C5ZQD6_MARMA